MSRGAVITDALAVLPPDAKRALAKHCGTTVVYLYQLAGQPDPNPSARLAFRLQDATTELAKSFPDLKPIDARKLCGLET